MKFLEKDLEDIIWDGLQTNHKRQLLIDRGLGFVESISTSKRQLRIGNYGITDIVTAQRSPFNTKELWINLIELKKDKISFEAVSQCARYIKGIERYLNKRGVKNHVVGTLIGSEIDKYSDFVYMMSKISDIDVYTYEYGIEGIQFKWEEMDYSLIEEGFK